MLNGLIIVCSVRGEKLEFSGSFKEKLESKIVYKQIKKTIKNSVLDLLNENDEIANDFIWRFDKTHIASGIY
jgi:DNA gyrase/topoisomerase IV subunit B